MLELLFRTDYLLLVFLWISWCVVHSALISLRITNYLESRLGNTFRYYRLFYNFFSIITVIPIMNYSGNFEKVTIFSWDGYLMIIQIILILFAFFMFYTGSKHYDGLQFLGIRQIKENSSHKVLTESGNLNTNGILGIVRHPWYAGAIAIIWVRDLDFKTIVVNIILTAYLIIGTILEERKLILEFGDDYKNYQRQVSMLFPYKWIISRLGNK